MKNLEQLQQNALHASFTEVQQAHFDKLMSELEVISGGLGFAELKEKAEAGDKEALQVMRDYIVKKEQIVVFIETKETPVSYNDIPFRNKELQRGDEVIVLRYYNPGIPAGSKGVIASISRYDDGTVYYSVDFGDKRHVVRPHIVAEIVNEQSGKLDLNKYGGFFTGQKLKIKSPLPEAQGIPLNIEQIDSILVVGFWHVFNGLKISLDILYKDGSSASSVLYSPKDLEKLYEKV